MVIIKDSVHDVFVNMCSVLSMRCSLGSLSCLPVVTVVIPLGSKYVTDTCFGA